MCVCVCLTVNVFRVTDWVDGAMWRSTEAVDAGAEAGRQGGREAGREGGKGVGGGPWMRALNICILMEMWRW